MTAINDGAASPTPAATSPAFCFLDIAEAEQMPVMLIPLDWKTVKRDLRDMVRQLVMG